MTDFCFNKAFNGDVGLLYRLTGGSRLGWMILTIMGFLYLENESEYEDDAHALEPFFLPFDLVFQCLSIITSNSSVRGGYSMTACFLP